MMFLLSTALLQFYKTIKATIYQFFSSMGKRFEQWRIDFHLTEKRERSLNTLLLWQVYQLGNEQVHFFKEKNPKLWLYGEEITGKGLFKN